MANAPRINAATAPKVPEPLQIAGSSIGSRLLLGTGGVPSMAVLDDVIVASGAEVVTVALRRVTPGVAGSVLDVCDRTGVRVLPNTAGCRTACEAVQAALAARDAFGTDWVKLEVIGDDRTLLPDPVESLDAAEQLVGLGFAVLPYAPATTRSSRRASRRSAAPR